ncbi:uncharacterized protein LOC113983742 isoform X4 [Pipra filicauda]|uniref:Uncharacterized protein LOC113983742 isoform X4 n=1 Tax=Pipra filicauda TaxID=649802 RepID=A0A7R5KC45_9PASS|nr:uncharacterized protein LOC113983742 isoform X4 [Pipra filicauda]
MSWEGATGIREIPTFLDVWDGNAEDAPGGVGANTGKREIPNSWMFGMGWEGATGSRNIPSFPNIWDGMGRSHLEQGHSHLPRYLGWDGKEPLGAGTFPPSQIFGNELGREDGSRSIPGSWLRGCKHWDQGHSQFLDVWDGMGRSHLEQGHSHLPRYLGMSWEGATGSRDIPTFPAVSFPAMTWNIPLPASRGTRNPRDSIPGLSQPLGATQTPPGMFIIPGKAAPFPHPGRFPAGKAAPGTSFPLFLSRDRAPIPLGMRISCRYSGIFSLLGNFFPSKSWINPGFFWGMGSFRSSFFFWEEGITGKSLFPAPLWEYPEGIFPWN